MFDEVKLKLDFTKLSPHQEPEANSNHSINSNKSVESDDSNLSATIDRFFNKTLDQYTQRTKPESSLKSNSNVKSDTFTFSYYVSDTKQKSILKENDISIDSKREMSQSLISNDLSSIENNVIKQYTSKTLSNTDDNLNLNFPKEEFRLFNNSTSMIKYTNPLTDNAC